MTRPLLQRADLKFRRRLIGFAIAAGCVAFALIVAEAGFGAMTRSVGLETYKLLLQFFLITAGGGTLLALVGHAQNVASQRQQRAASVQALDRELDAAYRSLKKVKRRLRANSRNQPDPDRTGHWIDRAVFDKSMDDLLDAQLRLETICDHIGRRDDILHPHRLKRMKGPLRYASRYYHDVHEDFERGRVRLEGGRYALAGGYNLNDFIRSSRLPAPGWSSAFIYQLERLKLSSADLSSRAEALDQLIAASPDEPAIEPEEEKEKKGKPDKIRYADVAAACFDLLSAELAEVRAKLLS